MISVDAVGALAIEGQTWRPELQCPIEVSPAQAETV